MSNPKCLYKPKRDCPNWNTVNGDCNILTETLCRTRGECGFYPLTAERRKARQREQRREPREVLG